VSHLVECDLCGKRAMNEGSWVTRKDRIRELLKYYGWKRSGEFLFCDKCVKGNVKLAELTKKLGRGF